MRDNLQIQQNLENRKYIENTYEDRKQNIENTYEGVQSRKACSLQLYKNRLIHRYEAKISETHSQKFVAFFQLI